MGVSDVGIVSGFRGRTIGGFSFHLVGVSDVGKFSGFRGGQSEGFPFIWWVYLMLE